MMARLVCQFLGHEDVVTVAGAWCEHCGQESPDWVQCLVPRKEAYGAIFAAAVQPLVDAFAQLQASFIEAGEAIGRAFAGWPRR